MIRAVDGQQLTIPLGHYWLLYKGKYKNGGGYKVLFDRSPLLRSEMQAIPLEATRFIEALGIPLQIHPHRRYAEKGQYTSPFIRVYGIYADGFDRLRIQREVSDFYESIGLAIPMDPSPAKLDRLNIEIRDGETIWVGKKPNGNFYKLYIQKEPYASWEPGTIYPEAVPFLTALGIPLEPHKRSEMAAKGCKMSPYVYSHPIRKHQLSFYPLSPQLKGFYESIDTGNEQMSQFLLKSIKDWTPIGLPDYFVLPQVTPDSLEDQDFESLWLEVSGHDG